MLTKEKILNAALSLYNENGINESTTRHIARSLEMSAGNLHYHFKHTEDIIIALFDQLEKEFDILLKDFQEIKNIQYADLNDFIKKSVRLLHRYKFIPLSFKDISNRIPEINQAYIQINLRRKDEFQTIFYNLVNAGICRNDIPDAIWDTFLTQIFVVGDFWLSYNEASFKLHGNEALNAHLKIMNALFFPYLSKKGQKLFQEI